MKGNSTKVTNQMPAPGIDIKRGEASHDLHDKLDKYMARRLLQGQRLTKPQAAIELLEEALRNYNFNLIQS